MDSVEKAIAAYFTALNGSDVEGLVKTFTSDGAFMGHEMETVSGHDQIRKAFEGHFRNVRFQREVHVDASETGDTFAVARTHTTGTLTILGAGTVIPLVGRELFVLRRSSLGWRISNYMFNHPGPG